MCGIVAAFSSGSGERDGGDGAAALDVQKYRRMLARINHRGPDDIGERLVGGHAWLGHQRLSIMDVTEGRQPLADLDDTTWIVANGEIYNFRRVLRDLPPELIRTRSDTEAALHLVMRDGPAAVGELNGMFAFALAGDGPGTTRALVARDRLGVKPLYWLVDGDVTLFASELRAFDPEDRPAVASFPPGSLWSPGTGLVRYADAVPVQVRPSHRAPTPRWDDEVLRDVREAVVAAVRRRMMSDVGVGVFLSGGLDSALVAVIAAAEAGERGERLPTFAVGTEDSGDLRAARLVAEHIGSDHTEIPVTPDSLEEALREAVEVIEHFDPALVRSAVPNLLLAREAVKQVKVVLTGEGADELFAGYSYMHTPEFADPDVLHAELVRGLELLHHLNLQRCDRASMYSGLEAREPFLDTDLVRTALALPAEWKQCPDGRPEKALLREAFTGWLPEELLWRSKEQFGDGSGAGTVLSAIAERRRQEVDQSRVGDVPPDCWTLRSREEVLYYDIWRGHFAGVRPSATLGAFATA